MCLKSSKLTINKCPAEAYHSNLVCIHASSYGDFMYANASKGLQPLETTFSSSFNVHTRRLSTWKEAFKAKVCNDLKPNLLSVPATASDELYSEFINQV